MINSIDIYLGQLMAYMGLVHTKKKTSKTQILLLTVRSRSIVYRNSKKTIPEADAETVERDPGAGN